MEFQGQIKDIMKDWRTGKWVVTLETTQNLSEGSDELMDKMLKCVLKVFHGKRSLSANAYFHMLNDKLAEKMHISRQECKNLLLSRYGQPFLDEDGKSIIIKNNLPMEQMMKISTMHIYPFHYSTDTVGGKDVKTTFYKLYMPTHLYDSKEMAELIEGTISECREVGIDPSIPAEYDHMIKSWKPQKEAC